jgi:fructose-bisphosphate aldolase class 1
MHIVGMGGWIGPTSNRLTRDYPDAWIYVLILVALVGIGVAIYKVFERQMAKKEQAERDIRYAEAVDKRKKECETEFKQQRSEIVEQSTTYITLSAGSAIDKRQMSAQAQPAQPIQQQSTVEGIEPSEAIENSKQMCPECKSLVQTSQSVCPNCLLELSWKSGRPLESSKILHDSLEREKNVKEKRMATIYMWYFLLPVILAAVVTLMSSALSLFE